MKYLPVENITYKTKLESEEVLNKLNEIIESKKFFRTPQVFEERKYKLYEWHIDGKAFNIMRIIEYNNSFLPRIKGVIEEDYPGTKVKVKMRLHPFIIVFMLIWFGGVGLGFLVSLSLLFNEDPFEPMTLIPLYMLIFGYALVTGGFKYESIQSKKYLAQLLEAEIE